MEQSKNELFDNQKQMDELLKILSSKVKLEKRKKELDQELIEFKETKYQLFKEVEKQEKRNKRTQSSILYRLFHINKNKLDTEMKSTEELKTHYNDLVSYYEHAYKEVNKIEHQLKYIEEKDHEYKKRYKELEKLLLSKNKDLYDQVKGLNGEIIEIEYKLLDINQALLAGSELKQELTRLIHHYDRALNWSKVDLFLGNSATVKYYKYKDFSSIDETMSLLLKLMKRFFKELQDVYEDQELRGHIPLGTNEILFLEVLDFDLAVMMKLIKAKDQLVKFYNEFLDLLTKLEDLKKDYDNQIMELYTKKGAIFLMIE